MKGNVRYLKGIRNASKKRGKKQEGIKYTSKEDGKAKYSKGIEEATKAIVFIISKEFPIDMQTINAVLILLLCNGEPTPFNHLDKMNLIRKASSSQCAFVEVALLVTKKAHELGGGDKYLSFVAASVLGYCEREEYSEVQADPDQVQAISEVIAREVLADLQKSRDNETFNEEPNSVREISLVEMVKGAKDNETIYDENNSLKENYNSITEEYSNISPSICILSMESISSTQSGIEVSSISKQVFADLHNAKINGSVNDGHNFLIDESIPITEECNKCSSESIKIAIEDCDNKIETGNEVSTIRKEENVVDAALVDLHKNETLNDDNDSLIENYSSIAKYGKTTLDGINIANKDCNRMTEIPSNNKEENVVTRNSLDEFQYAESNESADDEFNSIIDDINSRAEECDKYAPEDTTDITREDYNCETESDGEVSYISKEEKYLTKNIKVASVVVVEIISDNIKIKKCFVKDVLASLICGKDTLAKSHNGKVALRHTSANDSYFVLMAMLAAKRTKELGGDKDQMYDAALLIFKYARNNVKIHDTFKFDLSHMNLLSESAAQQAIKNNQKERNANAWFEYICKFCFN